MNAVYRKLSWRISTIVTAVTMVLLLAHLRDLGEQYGAGEYLTTSLLLAFASRPSSPPPARPVGDKVIVMGKMEDEDTSWVAEELPDWQRAIYVVNPSPATAPTTLTTSVNKGHESMAYLTYIIDNYNASLPSIVAFLHSHRNGFLKAWHTDAPLHDNVESMRHLQLPFVRRNGYVNLRCNWNPGCGKDSLNPHITQTVWEELFNETSTAPFDEAGHWIADPPVAASTLPKFLQDVVHLRGRTAATCCAQFAVSREQIRQRPLDDYIKLRHWLYHTEKSDAKSGRVMEYLWHVIFGRESVYCPDEDACYCSVYGRCS